MMAKDKHNMNLLERGIHITNKVGQRVNVRVERDGSSFIAYDQHYMIQAYGTTPDDALKNYRRQL